MPRYKALTPVTDYSVTSRIRVALMEGERTDLVIDSLIQPIKELEEAHALLQNRVVALEQEKVNWMTASGVYKQVDSALASQKGTFAVRAWVVLGGLALTAAGAAIERYIGK